MFWKKKSKSELQQRIDELEVDKKNYIGLVQYQSDQLMRQAENWKKTQKELNRKKEEINKWNKLGRLISSVSFDSNQKLVQDRGIELIKDLQKKANRPI